jgi:CRISPR/Cas system-associated protein endoribonuclease Cas2
MILQGYITQSVGVVIKIFLLLFDLPTMEAQQRKKVHKGREIVRDYLQVLTSEVVSRKKNDIYRKVRSASC